MPATKDIDTTASKVLKGDYIRIITNNRDYAMLVDTVKVGAKWTEARDPEGTLIFRRLNDDQIWAMRSMPTQAELAAAKEESARQSAIWHEEMLAKLLERMHGAVVTSHEAMTAAMAKGHYVSADIMEDMVIGQEWKTIACTVDRIIEHNPEMSIHDAMQHAADGIKEGLIDGRNEPTQSGGFSFRNAERQARITAQRKFIQGILWGTL